MNKLFKNISRNTWKNSIPVLLKTPQNFQFNKNGEKEGNEKSRQVIFKF